MDAVQASEKAMEILKKDGIDRDLITLYLTVRHYPSWALNDNFNESLNFGVTSISSQNEEINVSYKPKKAEMVVGEFKGKKFKIGGATDFPSYPDGSCLGFTSVRFGFGDDLKTVLEVKYEMPKAHEASSSDDYSLFTVDEFHLSNDWILFLKSTTEAIDVYKKKRDQKLVDEQNLKSEGKFTF